MKFIKKLNLTREQILTSSRPNDKAIVDNTSNFKALESGSKENINTAFKQRKP